MKSFLILFVFIFLAQTAYGQKFSKTPNFKELNEKIIIPKCLMCHNDEYAARQVYLVTYEDVKSFTVAGKPEASLLLEVVGPGAQPRMPMKAAPLNTEEMAYIRAWITGNTPE